MAPRTGGRDEAERPRGRRVCGALWCWRRHASAERLPLAQGWALQSSAKVKAAGEELSRPGFATEGWHRVERAEHGGRGARRGGGLSGSLLRHEPALDPGDDLSDRPALHPAADARGQPVQAVVVVPERVRAAGRARGPTPSRLRFDGINYRANIWLNGTRVADAKQVAGAFRRYRFDVTPLAARRRANAVAVEVFAPEPHDLAFMWVDWNPTPADKNMGLWGPVAVEHQRAARGAPPARDHEAGVALARRGAAHGDRRGREHAPTRR